MKNSRRAFAFRLLKLVLAVPLVNAVLTACGTKTTLSSGLPAPESGGGCVANGATSNVAANHGHPAPAVSAADIVAGAQKAYPVDAGSAGHTHSFTVSAAAFTTLQGNTSILVTTAPDGTGHTHQVTINCA